MDFVYSAELPAFTNSTGGLAGDIPVRRNLHGFKEEIGASQARRDWQKFVGNLDNFHGSMSPKYGLMQVAVPECLPERLSIIAYASEVGFLYDDSTELMSQVELERANDEMQISFDEGVRISTDGHTIRGLAMLQAKLVKEMKRIDAPRAHSAIKAWSEFLHQAAGREHEIVHESFDMYMQYRLLDVGEMFWFGLVTFGMALTIPDDEIPRLRELTRSCWKVLALQNDLCSYGKEVEVAKSKNASHVVNALWFLMRDHKVGLQKAMHMCKGYIEQCVAEYDQIVAKHRTDETLSKDSRTYLESLRYTISGDAAWSLICPRYNSPDAKL